MAVIPQKKITNLDPIVDTSLTDNDVLPIVSAGVTWKVTLANTALKIGRAFLPTYAVVSFANWISNNSVYNVKNFGAIGDNVNDDLAAIQAAFDIAAVNNAAIGTGGQVYFPKGNYKISGKIRIKNVVLKVFGEGRQSSVIRFEGVAAGGIVSDALVYNNLTFDNFGLIGDASSGAGIDLSATTSESYVSSFTNMYIIAGRQAFYAPNFFSSTLSGVFASSFNSHAFHIAGGPATSLWNCYAGSVGAGKAGYRMTGAIRLYSCNGVNSGDYWGVFGSTPGASDGFQADFPVTSYPDIYLDGCNVEAWNITGLYTASEYQKFEMHGGDFVRALGGNYHSLIRTKLGSLGTGGYVELDYVRALMSGGVATGSLVYTDVADFLVVKGPLSLNGIVGMYSVTYGAIRPAINEMAITDDYQVMAKYISALQTGRLTAVDSLNLGAAGTIGGINNAPAKSSGRFLKALTAFSDGVAKTVITVKAPNGPQSAVLRVKLIGSLGAGGAVGANEATASVDYEITLTRTAGLNLVATAGAVVPGASSSVVGGATMTITGALAAVVGGAGANNTVAFQVTITRGSGASTNHTCLVEAEIINANVTGITIT